MVLISRQFVTADPAFSSFCNREFPSINPSLSHSGVLRHHHQRHHLVASTVPELSLENRNPEIHTGSNSKNRTHKCEVKSRMMTMSTQTMCMCSPRIPQPGTCIKSPVSLFSLRRQAGVPKWSSAGFHRNGRGYSTLAMKEASPCFPLASSPEDDVSDHDVVPAEDTGVVDFTGTKIVELDDPISPVKLVDDQLPPLLSMIIDGLPPFKLCKYVDEAEPRMHEYVERYGNVISLDSYYRLGLSGAAYSHPGTISVDRLVAIAINYGVLFIVDDLFFDTPNEFLREQYGISRDVCESPEKILEYLDHLDALFGQQVQPRNPAPLIETIMWEVGQYTLGLTNPEWFNHYVACVVEHHHTCLATHVDVVQGHNLYFQDVESYAAMRVGNVGGKFIQCMVELGYNSYIPGILRTDPYMEKVTTAASIHLGFANDVYSYHKESSLEQNPCNLITVLMECEGKPLVQTVRMAIDAVNTYAREILDLEAKAGSSLLRIHMQGIKELIAGNIYFGYMDYRYRHADSNYPELRETAHDWKIHPHAKV